MYCVVVLYQSLSVGEKRPKNGDGNQLALIFFPGGCFIVESDVPQPDFKHDIFIGTA